jgi:hypothetical protein
MSTIPKGRVNGRVVDLLLAVQFDRSNDMKWFQARLTFLLLAIMLVTVPIVAAPKGPLSRDAALALIKQSGQCTTSGGEGFDFKPWITVPDKGQDPAGKLTNARIERGWYEFFVSVGVLREGSKTVIEANDCCWTGNYPATLYNFHGVPQPYVRITPEAPLRIGGENGDHVYLTFHEFHCTAVNGIRQTPSEAQVEVAFSASLTPLGEKLRTAMRAEMCHDCGYPPSLWKLVDTLPAPRIGTYRFALWDDGWRMAGPNVAKAVGAGVVSLGNYSGPDGEGGGEYQLELWRDESSGEVLGKISHVVEGVNDPAGQLQAISGDGATGRLKFSSKLLGESVGFDGAIQGDSISGMFTSTRVPKPWQTVLKRGEKKYERNYRSRSQWEEFIKNLMKCCGPNAKPAQAPAIH